MVGVAERTARLMGCQRKDSWRMAAALVTSSRPPPPDISRIAEDSAGYGETVTIWTILALGIP
jgi:hypothetical protein